MMSSNNSIDTGPAAQAAEPSHPLSPGAAVANNTASVGTLVLGLVSAIGLIFVSLSGLWWTDPDVELGERARPIYVHVPSVVAAYACFAAVAIGSAMWLWRKSEFWDKVATAAAEVGTVLIGLTLITGSAWGYISWGVWWTWDARLTSTLVLFLVYVGYLVLRATDGSREQVASRCATVGLAAIVLVPIVHKSVDWWRSNHQAQTVLGTFDPDIDGLQLFTLMAGMVTFLVLAVFLVMHRFRVLVLQERAGTVGLDAAIAARTSELASEATTRISALDQTSEAVK